MVLSLSLPLAACGAEDGKDPEERQPPKRTSAPAPAPESPEDFLALAAEAMAEEGAWTFSVKGEEGLTHQGQRSAASYRATVRRAMAPQALYSQGVSISSKGVKKDEEIYVADGTAHLRDGDAPWKAAPASDSEMRNKVEDAVAVIEDFRTYARAATGDGVKPVLVDGAVELRVRSGEERLAAVRDRSWVKKAVREFEPTAEQLREAGIPVDEAQVTLSGLEEVLVLDATTYRIRSYRFTFGFLVPYGGQDIAFDQDVRQENQGVFEGEIEMPAGVR
ncbi:hypothetical protein [Streptomyces finlayi]|uniref:hypothetical protein n=1 Tax=Streptomyces finlayi TaxID=67296 RepID=UPI002156674D|nr:hypothetical protein [Streptomyces finlayi]